MNLDMPELMHQVVLAFDFTPTAHDALQHAALLVARLPIHALHVVCVLEPGRELPARPELGDDPAKVQRAIGELLDATVKPTIKLANLHVHVYIRVGTPEIEILAVAREVGAELILIGSRNVHRRDHFAHGSVAQAVVHGAGCSVEVVRVSSYAAPAEATETRHAAQVYTYAPSGCVAAIGS